MGTTRRALLGTAAALLLPRLSSAKVAAEPPAGASSLRLGPPRPFDFESLAARAEALSRTAYEAPSEPAPEILRELGYDALDRIHYRRDLALFAEGPGSYPVTFFHLGKLFTRPARMFVFEFGGETREILYSPDYFDIPADSLAREMPADAGFAGFRLHEARSRPDWRTQDWVAFLGASYFRAIGAEYQYGLSARGIAVDTATGGPEEFPAFVEFHIASAPDDDAPVEILALLDGPSLAGAFRFAMHRREGVVMEVEARLFLRADVERLGVAPMTSMFWYDQLNRPQEVDWRPEVHDSDGLSIWTGAGERLWRPLVNPEATQVSSFADSGPRGFGLMQRDRDVEHYLDGVNYHRRPSLWVEPLDDWGEGAVELVEIPTADEVHDNIVAFWVPARPVRAGDALAFRYRLHWLADEPYPPEGLARSTATLGGRGGEPGQERPEESRKFVVDFAGAALAGLDQQEALELVVSASRGEIVNAFAEPVPDSQRWRAIFDLRAAPGAAVDLRLYLRGRDGRPLTETWLYSHRPAGPPG